MRGLFRRICALLGFPLKRRTLPALKIEDIQPSLLKIREQLIKNIKSKNPMIEYFKENDENKRLLDKPET